MGRNDPLDRQCEQESGLVRSPREANTAVEIQVSFFFVSNNLPRAELEARIQEKEL